MHDKCSLCGVQTVQVAGPIQDPAVGCYQSMAVQCGGYYDAICRVGMKILETVGPDSYLTVHGNLDDALIQ